MLNLLNNNIYININEDKLLQLSIALAANDMNKTNISEDEKTRTLAELREKAQADYESAMANQRREGWEEGIEEGQQKLAKAILEIKSGAAVDETAQKYDIDKTWLYQLLCLL